MCNTCAENSPRSHHRLDEIRGTRRLSIFLRFYLCGYTGCCCTLVWPSRSSRASCWAWPRNESGSVRPSRQQPQRPARQVVAPELIQAVQRYLDLAPGEMNLRDFWRAVARLGGFIGRKSDGDPGWQTLSTVFGGVIHVAWRRPETMKRTNAIIRTDEAAEAGCVFTDPAELVEESDPSRTDVPETVVPVTTGRTRRRMFSRVPTPTASSSRLRRNPRHQAALSHGRLPETETKRVFSAASCTSLAGNVLTRQDFKQKKGRWQFHRPLNFTPHRPLFGGQA